MDARLLIERQRPAGLIARIQMPNMQSLPNIRTRRNTACAMLFVWLFALASGVANACLLEPHGVHDHGSPLSHPSASGTTLGMAGDHAQGLAHDDGASDPGPTKESCLKACDEGSQSLLKHAYSFDFADPGLAPLVAAAWAAEVHLAPASGRLHDFRLPERGPPIRVLFSRLAL
ncbi:MAG: hypothetical protein ABI887_21440 [Burkholderiales bacterium]